ncbi:MAG: FtsW/RodA/SpoVE family cell cycle protein [Armatimonadetes bacterium]|nr:FtsW/RodA/SpoVE family cell cycle protein [Armatimonadota bacterium]
MTLVQAQRAGAAGRGSRLAGVADPRALEFRLWLGTLPLAFLGCVAAAAPRTDFRAAFLPVATPLGLLLAAALAVHLLFRLIHFRGDPLILPILTVLLIMGAVYHAGLFRAGAPGGSLGPYLRAGLVALGTVGAVVGLTPLYRRLSYWVEERLWWRIAGAVPYYESIPFLLGLGLLMVVLILWLLVRGRPAGLSGAIIQAPLLGGWTFTPSEFVRLAVAFFLADYLGRNSKILRNLRQPLGRRWPLSLLTIEHAVTLSILLAVVALYCLFFFAFRDYGPAVIIYGLAIICLYAATGRWPTPAALVLLGALLAVLPTLKGGGGTLTNRLMMWWNPWDTGFLNGDHQVRILWAITGGGWLGMPAETGVARQLPEAATDAAFAGLVARHGLWVGAAVLFLFALLAARGLSIARAASTDRARLLALSLTLLILLQVVWICGAMVRAFPFSGINLPFISTGTSNALACAIALGALLNLSRGNATVFDPGEATPEVERGVRRLGKPLLALYLVPLGGLALLAPPVFGDAILVRRARAMGQDKEIILFRNPYLEAFVRGLPRGRLYSADGELLAVSNPGPDDYARIRESNPDFEPRLRRLAARGLRAYPLGELAAQLVGWTTGGQYAPREGSIETACDSLLRGYRDAELPYLFRTRLNPFARKPRPADLETTIDAALQRQARQLLRQAALTSSGTGGAVVLLEADTGRVLAAATSPSFDPNELSVSRMRRYLKEHRRTGILTNKALDREARYPPGSTFKILTLAAALPALPEGTVTCAGHNTSPIRWEYRGRRYQRPARRISCYGGAAHGSLSLGSDYGQALTRSCNVFFATLAAATGVDRLRETLRQAELGQLPAPDRLADFLPEAGFGQVVVSVSPLEMAMVAGAIGMAVPAFGESAPAARPYWLNTTLMSGERSRPAGVYGAPDERPYRPFPDEIARRVREGMLAVVNDPSGTAYGAFHPGGSLALPGVVVGGKTGTAEFEKESRDSRGRRRRVKGRHAWFVGFARNDRDVQPKTLAIAVLVEDVGRGATGGSTCAPVARELFRAAFAPWQPPAPADQPPAPVRPPWWREWLQRLFQ